MSKKRIPPPIRTSNDLQLIALSWEEFQALCRDLSMNLPDSGPCSVFGTQGQKQRGADLKGEPASRVGIEIAQCKREKSFTKGKVKRASKEFLDHWENYWSSRDVRKFRLFVACELDTTECQEQLEEERKRFEILGIAYEPWPASRINNELRKCPALVTQYFGEGWAEIVCGVPKSISQGPDSSTLSSTLDQMASVLSGHAEAELDQVRNAWREGRKREAVERIGQLCSQPVFWDALAPTVKAKILRFRAVVAIEREETTQAARQFAAAARAVSPDPQDTRVDALIANADHGIAAAIALLNGETDRDSLNLLASFQLFAGQLFDCEKSLDLIEAQDVQDAESLRIRALLHIAKGDVPSAQLCAQRALELQPLWESVRIVAAVVNYQSAISSAAKDRANFLAVPSPVEWCFVKRDPDALDRLREAEKVFDAAIQREDRDGERRRSLQTWRLACLANDVERQDLAQKYLKSVLDSEPHHPFAVIWALARGYAFNLDRAELSLREAIVSTEVQIEEVLALAACFLSRNHTGKAQRLLEAHRDRFTSASVDALWRHWYVQILSERGREVEALEVLQNAPDDDMNRDARTFASRNSCRHSGDWQPLIEHLQSCYRDTGTGKYLYELCEVYAQLDNWNALADLAGELVIKVDTADGMRLAAQGLFNADRFSECAVLLASADRAFPSRILPYDLRRARMECLRRLGSIIEAKDEAEALSVLDGSTTSLLDLIRVYATQGDFAGISRVARRLLARDDLEAEQALRVAWQIRLEDPTVAKALLKLAVDTGIADDAVAPAWLLAAHLGASDRVEVLAKRFEDLASKGLGGIHRVTIDELPTLLDKWNRRANELAAAYDTAALPVHVLAELGEVILGVLYHLLPSKNSTESIGSTGFRLLARHGGRPMESPMAGQIVDRPLVLDITAFLIASHFEFLGVVERAFRPIKISASLIPALQSMRERLLSRQPEIVGDWSRIVELVERGLLKLHIATDEAQGEGSSRSIQAIQVVCDSDGLSESVSVKDVVDALEQAGDLSAADRLRAARVLGFRDTEKRGNHLEDRAPLIFKGTAIEQLAHAGAIDAAMKRFELSVDAQEITRLRQELVAEREREQLGEWLGRRIEYLRLGLDSRSYELLPVSSGASTLSTSTPEMGCLWDLLFLVDLQGAVVWVDDRWANSHTSVNQFPIVDAIQILRGLRGSKYLDDDAYFETIRRMRAANVFFIPLDSEEILFHLRRTKIQDGRLDENQGLRTLRRYAAKCLECGSILQKPMLGAELPNPKGEFDFLLEMNRSVSEAIVSCWRESEVEARQRADWLFENLYVDLAGLASLAHWRESTAELSHLMAVSLAGLIGRGFTLVDKETKLGDLRRKYFEWLRVAVLEPRLGADPLLVQSISQLVKGTLQSLVPASVKTMEHAAAIRVLQGYFTDLPNAIREEMARDAAFMTSLGMKAIQVVHLGDLRFESHEFVKALKAIAAGSEANLKPIGSETPIILYPCSSLEREDALAFRHPRTGGWAVTTNDSLGVLRDTVRKREQMLRDHREWFDLPKAEIESAIADIATTRNPASRIEKLRRHQEASAALHYANLNALLLEKGGFQPNEVSPPRIDCLLRHLRIDASSVGEEGFREAALRLIDDEGPIVALERFAGLPSALPSPIVEIFANSEERVQGELIRKLLEMRASPLAQVHLTHMLSACCASGAKSLRQIRLRLSRTVNLKTATSFKALRSALTWSYNEIVNRSESTEYPRTIHLLLAWFHAHKLVIALRETGAPWPWVEAVFPRMPQRTPSEIFDRDMECWSDVCHPARVNWDLFGLSAVHYACAGNLNLVAKSQVQSKLQAFAIQEFGDLQLPNPALIVASNLARNNLASFLGGDPIQKLVDLVGVATGVSTDNLRAQTEVDVLLAQLEDETRQDQAWLFFSHVLGIFPVPDHLRSKLKDVLMRADFARMIKRDKRLGLVALFEASVQSLNLRDDELAARLSEVVKDVAMLLPQLSEAGDPKNDALLLIEAAANVSLHLSPPGSGVAAFSALACRIIDRWPQVAGWIAPLIATFQRELPTTQATALWPLSVKIRTFDYRTGRASDT